ncbi:GlxA family transcriptional regulator [Halocynthiibacter namhaensis]|uniref:GlxA family transcriptional regulator n=1 Tax=Halocynthiibacter namhaensis TaxID=1290553 RepID=UPI000579498A|nr:helix-turn-helix domain-containing protein [Halocynthiibacter namhaensis]
MATPRASAPAEHPEWHVDILLTEGFVLTELASVVDVLRIANRVSAHPLFHWHYRSRKGGPVGCLAGLSTDTTPFPSRPTADYAFILGNSDPDCPELSMRATISTYNYRNIKVLLMSEAASRYIAETGEQHSNHTTHWENRALLDERGTPGEGSYALAVDDGKLMTCAGMGSTVDVTLSLLRNHMSAAAVATVSDIMLHEKIRGFSTLQPFGGKALSITGDSDLDQCIELMQNNMEEPLQIGELVALIGISSRSLERKFRHVLGSTPNTYYRELRLNRANTLLLNTSLSVREISLACGFPNGFSSLFRSHFSVTPLARRKSRFKVQITQ